MGSSKDSRKNGLSNAATQVIVISTIMILASAIVGCAAGGEDPNGASQPPTNTTPTLAVRIQAADATAQANAFCTTITPFYWEIGDTTAALGSGTIGGTTPTASTFLQIASATKMFFGAYLLEKTGGTLTLADTKSLTMKTGYTNLNPLSCSGTFTVLGCFNAGANSAYNAIDNDMFSYNGGHFQKRAVDLGLGAYTDADLATEFKNTLGNDLPILFSSPQLAGGVVTTPSGYALFLRKLLNQTLRLGARLGEGAVCTLPAVCSTATSSPIQEAWHYAYGHWVEDDPTTGDGSFSSPGAFGFYPWIDSSTRYYGILARQDSSGGAAWDSVQCGRVIRKAFMTGIQQ